MTSANGSHRARRVAHRVLHWYPRRWRVRYAPEMRALLDEMPVAWRQVVDLGVGAAREWISPRAFGWPARSAAGRMQVVRGFKYAICVVAIELTIHQVIAPDAVSERSRAWLKVAVLAVLFATLARVTLGFFARWQRPRWLVGRGWFGALGGVEIAGWFVGIAIWLAFRHTEPVPAFSLKAPLVHVFVIHLQLLIWVNLLFHHSDRTQRLRRVLFSHYKRVAAASRAW